MQIIYKNTPIHFSSEGRGNPLVLLHGFLESKEIWKDFAQELSGQRQVICIDLPGHGNSGVIDEIHPMAEMASSVKAVLDELEVKQAMFAGHSMGGYVCLEVQNLFPTIPRGLALINSTPKADSEERKINRDKASELVKKNKKAFVKMAIANLTTPENNHKFEMQIKDLQELALGFSKEGIIAALQGMKIRTDYTHLFAEMKNPKYIIAGEQDPVLDHQEMKKIAKLSNSVFLSFPGGHLSFIENKKDLMKFLHFID